MTDVFHHAGLHVPALRGERWQKNGHTSHGAQRAKCVDCQRTFTLAPKGARYDSKFKDQVLGAYQDRMSLRGIKRTFGVCYQTIMVWLWGGKRPGTCPRSKTRFYPVSKKTCSSWMNSGALLVPKRRRSSGGWLFVGARARSWSGPWATKARKARVTCG